MSLLSICTAVANYIPVAVPTVIIGNSDTTAQLMLAAANLAGQELARRPPGGWVAMQEQYEFQTAATTQVNGTISNGAPGGLGQITIAQNSGNTTALAPLLVDFNANLTMLTWTASGTGVFNNTNLTSMVSSGGNWVINLNTAAQSTGSGQFEFGKSDYPLPSDFERAIDNTFWDRTRYWAMRGPQSPQQWQLYKSSVIGKATIQRRYRFLEIAGAQYISIDPTPFDNGSYLVFEYTSNAWCKSATGTPQTSFLADSDVGILDEYLIQLGVLWRTLRRLGLSYSDELADYERQVDKALGQDGAAGLLDLTPIENLSLIGPWNIQDGYFPS